MIPRRHIVLLLSNLPRITHGCIVGIVVVGVTVAVAVVVVVAVAVARTVLNWRERDVDQQAQTSEPGDLYARSELIVLPM